MPGRSGREPVGHRALPSVLCDTLVGRDRELATAAHVLAGSDRRRVVAVVGDAGMGKSALVRSAAATAGRLVLESRATPDGRPLRPLAELAAGAMATGARLEDASLDALRGGLAPLLPGPEVADLERTSFPLVAAEALLALIGTLGRTACLVFEDLHWATPEALEAIERICDRAATRPVTVALISRRPCAAADMANRLETRRTACLIHVPALGDHDVDEMVRRCLGGPPPDGLTPLVDNAGGNPFHVEELLRSAVEAGVLRPAGSGWVFQAAQDVPVPATLSESVDYRLAQLPRATQRILAVAALLGEGVGAEALAVAAGTTVDEVEGAARAGAELQLVDPGANALRFRHALTAEIVGATLSTSDRATAARDCLAALTATARPAATDPATTARVAELAGDRDAASRHRLDAARAHLAGGAISPALAEVDRALDLCDSPAAAVEIHLVRLELLSLAGLAAEVMVEVARLDALGVLPRDDRLRRDLAVARGGPDPATRQVAIERALADAAGHALEGRVAATAGLLAADEGDLAKAGRNAQRALAALPADEDPASTVQALEVLGRVARATDLVEADRLFSRAAAMADEAGLALWRARALHERATIEQLRTGGRSGLESARTAAIAAGSPGLIASIDFHLAAVATTGFDGIDGLAAARRLGDLAGTLGRGDLQAWASLLTGYAHLVNATWVQAAPALHEAARLDPQGHEVPILAEFFERGFQHLLRGDPATAQEAYALAIDRFAGSPGGLSPLPPWYLGPLLMTVRDTSGHGAIGARARSLADRADLQVASTVRGSWLLAEAVAAGRSGDIAVAARRSDEATALWADHPALEGHRVLARWLAADAARADGWGDPDRWLGDAEAWAAARGYPAIADDARARLRAAGVTPRRRRGTTPVPESLHRLGVTGREVDVLALVASGLTNAEIADALHLSPGTVKGYVSQLLTKTGTAKRAGLAALAVANGIAASPR